MLLLRLRLQNSGRSSGSSGLSLLLLLLCCCAVLHGVRQQPAQKGRVGVERKK